MPGRAVPSARVDRRGAACLAARLVALAALLPGSARAGHEIPFYPSFYPQEIRLHTLTPVAGARHLGAGTLHAYLGADPYRGRMLPAMLREVRSLRGYVALTFNTTLAPWREASRRCDAARRVALPLASRPADFTAYPYPVTPYHADLFWYTDRVQAARAAVERATDTGGAGSHLRHLRLRARGEAAQALVGRAAITGGAWDAIVEDVDLEDLLATGRIAFDGWLGTPWLRAGWFQAYLLERPTLADSATGREVDALVEKLTTAGPAGPPAAGSRPDDLTERIRLERRLVDRLAAGCERVVLGFTTRREVYTADFSAGIENVAVDAQDGLAAPVFVRTAKLKDFPWNGSLDLATPARPASAWNPIGGFTDRASRLVWAAIGDPALFPAPGGAEWVENRVSVEAAARDSASGRVTTSAGSAAPQGRVMLPEDAVLPEPGTGILRPVGPGRTAALRLRYRVLGGAFHDGSRTTAADLYYPFAVAYRWGAPAGPRQPPRDTGLAAATALLRERLAGLRVAGSESLVRDFGDVKLFYTVHLVDVYLRGGADSPGFTGIAPPWSPVPWHVLAVTEEAARRRRAALSRTEAERSRAPWLDVVRDGKTRNLILETLAGWERTAAVPPALAGLVTDTEAKARWSALRAFAHERGHILATAGPYRLDRLSTKGAVLGVFRDLSYPLGVGTYDRFATPRRAWVRDVQVQPDRLLVAADIEVVERAMRDVRRVRQPLVERRTGIAPEDVPRCRYLVVGADGEVARAAFAPFVADAQFAVDLSGLSPGSYAVAVALTLGDHELDPEVKVVQYRAAR